MIFEVAVSAKSARVHDPLRDALAVEVKDLFAEMKIFECRGAAGADLQRIFDRRRRECLVW
jgi:hypothetical protein